MSISDDAFLGCTGLTAVYYTGDIASWCNITFSNEYSNPLYYAYDLYIDNELVRNLVIPDSVTEIKNFAFVGCCINLKTVTIPNSVTSIGNSAFEGCMSLIKVNNLSSLNIVAGSTDHGYVGYFAKNVYTPNDGNSNITTTEDGYQFYNDNSNYYLIGYVGNETNLVLPTDINGNNYSIYQFAFGKNKIITNITIPDGVTSIGRYAFRDCWGLTNVIIANNVTSISWEAFYECSNLNEVYYHGTSEEWDNITIENHNDALTSATRYYYSETQPTGAGNYWHYVGGVVTKW